MLLKLAWRNIWRNKRRSLIVVGSVIVGVIALIIIDGLNNGFLSQMLFNQVNLNISHIQIHKKGFNDNKTVQSFIPDKKKVESVLAENKKIKHYSERVVSFGLVSSAVSSSGVFILGINPGDESKITTISKSIIKGKYFSGKKREIVIGNKLAEKLKVDLGGKVITLANRPDGSIGSEVFRIVGIFQSPSSEFNKAYIFVPIGTLQNMLGIGNNIHEFAIVTEDYNLAETVKEEIKQKLNNEYEVLSYQDILPLLIMQMDLYKESMYIINMIIGLALIFGIINSMLMAVFERINEIGVLMAIGMKNGKIFSMILLESLLIGVLGTAIGLVLGFGLNEFLAFNGIDLSLFSKSLESWGIGAVIYPQLSIENLINTLLTIPFITVVGAIYPAWKAIKLEPVVAIRYV